MSKAGRRGLVLCLLLAIASGSGVVFFTGPEVVMEERIIRTEHSLSGRPLRYELILPADHESAPPRSRPAVVAIPPYSIPAVAMEIICIEIARRGGACAIPDFFGKTAAESRQHLAEKTLGTITADALSLIGLLRRLPFVDPDRVGACGHSVGGTVTVLAGLEDPRLRAAVPIGMEADFNTSPPFNFLPLPPSLWQRRLLPQNLLFLSGLYDEIHAPDALLENLTENGIEIPPLLLNRSAPAREAAIPAPGQTYGDFAAGTARQVSIIPTTDHFIETFDPFLIRELLDWFASALDAPGLKGGLLREWWRRTAVLIFAFSLAGVYFLAGGALAAAFVRRQAPHMPGWLLLRLPALPLLLLLFLLLAAAAQANTSWRLLFLDLMLVFVFAHELISHRLRGILVHPGRSSFRLFRSAALAGLALGASTLLSFGAVCFPYFFLFPDALRGYPLFVVHMTILFPLQVWSRLRPWFFTDVISAVDPQLTYYFLVGLAVLIPGLLAGLGEALARVVVLTLRAQLPPLTPEPTALAEAEPSLLRRAKERAELSADRRTNIFKAALAVILIIIFVLVAFQRVQQGMLTAETARLALFSVFRFAILPFLLAALFLLRPSFRRLSLLD